ncbi:MAG TPA: hypothetical protein PKC91_06500, partial [Ignavibacteria bacterium]|nr:hypothetical protein [Ignavibacteria bacterium]
AFLRISVSIFCGSSTITIRYFRKFLNILNLKDLNIKTELNKLADENEREEKFIPYRNLFLQIIKNNITA